MTDPSRTEQIRYERLCVDPTAALRALARFMETFEEAGEAFGNLTCREAEALAELWDLVPEGGDWVRRSHADGDEDCEDQHHGLWLELHQLTPDDHDCGAA